MGQPNDPADWLKAWSEAQARLWSELVPGQQPASGQGLPEPGPAGAEAARKLMEFGEDYLGVTREFWKLLQQAGQGQAPAAGTARLQPELEGLRDRFIEGYSRLLGTAPTGDALSAWQQMAAGAMPAGPWPYAQMPAFGPLRERQTAHQRLIAATVRYQRAVSRFGELMKRVASEAVDRLAREVADPAAVRDPVASLRALHDLWVECGERAYAAAAHGSEFAAVQAELNEALLDLRAEQQKQLEDWARTLDLPTRSELNTINERLQALRRRVRELEEEFERRGGGPG